LKDPTQQPRHPLRGVTIPKQPTRAPKRYPLRSLEALPLILAGAALLVVLLANWLRHALLRANPARVLEGVRGSDERARLAALLERAPRLALGATVLSLGATLTLGLALDQALHRPLLSGALAWAALLLLGEVLPQALALRLGDALLNRTLWSFSVLQWPLLPLVVLVERLQRALLRVAGRDVDPSESHGIVEDLREVVEDLRAHGYPFELDWFAPHWEFRFPKLGDFEAGGVRVDLRMALEPWPVMGEEGAAGGTVRFVDASLERIELSARGLIEGRHALTVNGRTVPLQRVGPEGAQVGGVRYRAWKPSSCLHPTIDPHVPLVVDLVDTWNRRSIGGCQYHVAHPGGRNHETFPVNAYEAEARRLARFFRMGHTPGEMTPNAARIDPETPCTLDLRRA